MALFLKMIVSAIDLVDEAAANLRMETTSKPTELDEIEKSFITLEMKKAFFENGNQ